MRILPVRKRKESWGNREQLVDENLKRVRRLGMNSHSHPRGVDDPIRTGPGTDHDPNTDLRIELASFNITAVSMKHTISIASCRWLRG